MKKQFPRISLLLVLIIFSTFSKLTSANYFWIGGSGNWSSISHWATSSGGSVLQSVVPGPNDDVFFDGSSGFTASSKTIIVDVSAVCRNMTWMGALNTPMLFGGASNPLNIYGSLVLQNNMSFSVAETRFKSLFTGETISTNGINIEGNFVFDGPGSWMLLDDLKNTGTVNYRTIFLMSGTLNTNGKRVTTGIWTSTSGSNGVGSAVNLPATFNLILGSSTIICTNTNYTWYYLGTGTTLNAGTSQIVVNSSATGGLQYLSTQPGHLYYNLTVNNPFSQTINCTINNTSFHRVTFFESAGITGSARFDSLIFTGGNAYKLPAGSTHTITAALVSTVAACGGVIDISSNTSGSQATFTFQPGASAAVTSTSLKDIRATGAIIPVAAVNSFDMSNNTGFVFTPPLTKTLYWVGASGNWNDKQHWSTNNDGIYPSSSGGCVPTPIDNVIFNANSGFTVASKTVTLADSYQYCQNMTWTGATNTPLLTGGTTSALNIYGSMVLQNTMVYNIYEARFKSLIAGRTITTSGVNIDGNFYFDGFGGWTLLDDVNNTGSFNYRGFYLVMGTLNTNSRRVTTGTWSSGNNLGNNVVLPTTVSIILGSSIITCINPNNPWFYIGNGTSINAGTSHIIITSAAAGSPQYSSTSPGHAYYNFTVNNPFNQSFSFSINNTSFHRASFFESSIITGGAKFDSLIFSVGNTYKLQSSTTHTIVSALVSTVTPCSGVIEISTSTAGTQATFSFLPGSAAAISNTLLKDIAATGAIVPINTINSFDLGNTTNFIFPVASGNTLYWVGGTGNWTDKLHWSTNNDGIYPASSGGCVPTPADNVVFNNNSGFTTSSRIVTLSSSSQYCRSMTWTGALNTPTLTGAFGTVLNIYGSMTLQNNMAYSIFETRFKAVASAETISTSGINIDGNFYFEGSGSWTLLDNLNNTGVVNFRGLLFLTGTLNTNGKQVTTGMWSTGLYTGTAVTLPNIFTANLGSSTIICTNPNNPWNYQGTGANLNAGTSNVMIASTINAGFQYFYSQPNHVYYNLTVNSKSPGLYATFTGLTFHKADISAMINITGSAKFDTLIFNAGYVYSMQAASTLTVNNAFYTSGNPCFVVFLKSLTSGTRANINVLAGNTSYDYVDAKDINASGLSFSAAGHSTNSGNNLNWSFAPTTTLGIVGLGPDQMVPCNAFPFTLNTTNFYPNPTTTFSWYNASTSNTIAVADSGRYFISVNYGASCVVKDTIRLSKPAALPVTASASTNTICNGSSVNLSASGVTSYLWSTGSTNSSISVSPSTSTVYSVTGTDVNSCTNTKTLSITVNPTPVVGIASVSSASICPGNNTTITPSGLSSYTLQPGNVVGTSFNVSPATTTTYTINGTSAAGCISTAASAAQTIITVNSTPVIGITSVSSSSICSGNNTIITPNGSSTYTLQPGNVVGTSFNVSPATSTTYTINGTNASGCTNTPASAATTAITVNSTPVIGVASVSSASICPGNNTTITPSGAATYTLTPGNIVGTSFNVSPASTTTYTINGTNAAGCRNSAGSAATTVITVNATPAIGITSVSSSSICSGNNTIITPNGSATYTLQPGNVVGTSFNVSPATSTTYTISGTSSAGCISTAASAATTAVIVNPTPVIGITSVSNATICSGNNTIITPNGAASYTLIPGNIVGTSFNVSPATSTTYTINGTSAAGCINTSASAATTAITVNSTPVIGIASVSSASICPGNNTTITPNGAATYTLTPGNVVGTSFNVSPASTTTYTINGTSAAGCRNSAGSAATTVITVNTTPTIAITSVSNATICSGNNTVITPNGSSTYTLQPGNVVGTSFNVSPATSTTYTISGTSSAGCISTAASAATTAIIVNPTPVIGITSVSNASICPGNTSIITPNGAGSYTLQPGNVVGTSFNVSPASTTTYTINGTNAAGCINTAASAAQTTIIVNPTPVIGITSVSSPSICSGNSSVITPNGSSTYTLQPGNVVGTSFNVSPSVTTTYTINGTSTAGCISTAASEAHSTITVHATPTISIGFISSNTICPGNSSVINPIGSTTYTLMPGNITGTSFTVSPVSTTGYTISGTSAAGCITTPASVATTTVAVSLNPSIGISSVSSSSICPGNSSVITPNGSATYTLMPGNLAGTSFTVSPASTTSYTISGTSAAGCISPTATPVSTTITVNPIPVIGVASVSNSVICSGDNTTITPSGSATYTLMPGNLSGTSFTVNPLVSTTYTINGTSTAGCISTAASEAYSSITVNATPTIAIASVSDGTVCAGNSSIITPSGSATYTLMPGNLSGTSFTVNPLITTTYTVNGSSSAGCISTSSSAAQVSITVNALPVLTASSVSNVSCFGQANGSISLTPAGGSAPYTINPAVSSGLTAGNYTYTVTDALGCINTTVVAITQPTAALASSENTVSANTDCISHNGSASVTLSGGTPSYTVNWSSGETGNVATTLNTGTNSYTVTDANGCSVNGAFTLPGVTGIITTAISQQTVNCFGAATGVLSFTTSGSGPFNYTLTSSSTTVTNSSGSFTTLPAGTYTLNVTGSGGCTDAGVFGVTEPLAALSTATVNAGLINCFGGTAVVTASISGGTVPYSYTWQNNASVSNTASYAAGNYSLVVSDANNCTSVPVLFTVSQPAFALTVTEISLNPACVNQSNGSVTIDVTGGTPSYSIVWSNGSTGLSVTDIAPGNLSAVITDVNGCVANYATAVPDKACIEFGIPQFFTPNGDGKNDLFTINGLENYPDNSLTIFNRWGSMVYSKKKYANNWEGKANVSDSSGGGMLPSGTYFIVFDFGDGKSKPYSGYVELKY